MSATDRLAEHPSGRTTSPAPAERSRVWADALFAAVAALQAQLTHPNAEVVREAAVILIDLEKTRLRHDRPLAGTACVPLAPRVGCSDPLAEPHTACADYTPDGPLPELAEVGPWRDGGALPRQDDPPDGDDFDDLDDDLDPELEARIDAELAAMRREVEERRAARARAAEPVARPTLAELLQRRAARPLGGDELPLANPARP